MSSRTYVPSFSLASVNNQKFYIATRNHDTVTTTAYAEPEEQGVELAWEGGKDWTRSTSCMSSNRRCRGTVHDGRRVNISVCCCLWPGWSDRRYH